MVQDEQPVHPHQEQVAFEGQQQTHVNLEVSCYGIPPCVLYQIETFIFCPPHPLVYIL